METSSIAVLKMLTRDTSEIASQAVSPACAFERPAARAWLTFTASPLAVTPSVTLTAPRGTVARIVTGMAPGRSASNVMFSGRTEIVTGVPRLR